MVNDRSLIPLTLNDVCECGVSIGSIIQIIDYIKKEFPIKKCPAPPIRHERIIGLAIRAYHCIGVLVDVDFVNDSAGVKEKLSKGDALLIDRRKKYISSFISKIEMTEAETEFKGEYSLTKSVLSLLNQFPVDHQPEPERMSNIKNLMGYNYRYVAKIGDIDSEDLEFNGFDDRISYLRTVLFLYARVLPLIPGGSLGMYSRIDGACIDLITLVQWDNWRLALKFYNEEVNKNKTEGTRWRGKIAIAKAISKLISNIGEKNINSLPERPHRLFNSHVIQEFIKIYPKGDWPIRTATTFVKRLKKEFPGVLSSEWVGKKKKLWRPVNFLKYSMSYLSLVD